MQFNLAKTNFYFPKIAHKIESKRELIHAIKKEMRKDGNIKLTGYLKEKVFIKDLSDHLGKVVSVHQNLSRQNQKKIKKCIQSAITKSHRALPHPDTPIFVFVYPWFPSKKNDALFQGVTAFASYYTMHLFINLESYTIDSLQQTVAHEWNHLVFYRYHPAKQYMLSEHMIMEGLAEIFREEVMGGDISPWSLALSKINAYKKLKSFSQQFLLKKGMKEYRAVFFGNKNYKRWTGYSIGYWIVKDFRQKNKNLSWKKILNMNPVDILARNTNPRP